jgi:hypothetical protein
MFQKQKSFKKNYNKLKTDYLKFLEKALKKVHKLHRLLSTSVLPLDIYSMGHNNYQIFYRRVSQEIFLPI